MRNERGGSRWTKPLMVAVPLLIVLTFFYTAVQFTQPDFPFIPKGAKVNRFNVILDKSYGPPNLSLAEATEFTWTLEDKDWESVKKAILAKGFAKPYRGHMSAYLTFDHPNGDRVDLLSEGASRTFQGESLATLGFMHEETRPVQQKIKYFLHWLKNRK